MKIDTSLRLSSDGYHQAKYEKKAIVLHHTVGGSARSTYHWWERDGKSIATAYIIGRDGVVYEVFDPRCWAWHLGLKGTNGFHDRRTIGIELASVGPLVYDVHSRSFYAFDRVTSSTKYTGEIFDAVSFMRDDHKWRAADLSGDEYKWRGWRFFACYTNEQTQSAGELIRKLSSDFGIELSYPDAHELLPEVPESGVYAHFHVRSDKSDVHLGFDWSVVS